jgi:hypothetical protein
MRWRGQTAPSQSYLADIVVACPLVAQSNKGITISFLLYTNRRLLSGESNMPSTVNLYLIGVWFCVGFFTGSGWAVAAWLVGRILSIIHI